MLRLIIDLMIKICNVSFDLMNAAFLKPEISSFEDFKEEFRRRLYENLRKELEKKIKELDLEHLKYDFESYEGQYFSSEPGKKEFKICEEFFTGELERAFDDYIERRIEILEREVQLIPEEPSKEKSSEKPVCCGPDYEMMGCTEEDIRRLSANPKNDGNNDLLEQKEDNPRLAEELQELTIETSPEAELNNEQSNSSSKDSEEVESSKINSFSSSSFSSEELNPIP